VRFNGLAEHGPSYVFAASSASSLRCCSRTTRTRISTSTM